ncbi:hypothetical protein E2I00_019640 [Balaenoptera physalus]|uniref:Uncharacterized protein n=1 Tax=Balaenoptera physalus TaxID=9770 RepID=A0A6A1Q8A5_BALPH|nr:hypothetical protein E2I00_019640 [Balaenoptera physalus]
MDVELQPPAQEELPDRTPPVDLVALGPRPMKSLFGTNAANIDVYGTQDLPRKHQPLRLQKDLRALPTGSGLPSLPGSAQQGSRQLVAQVGHLSGACEEGPGCKRRIHEQRRPHCLACANASMPLAMNDFSVQRFSFSIPGHQNVQHSSRKNARSGRCLSSPGAMPVMDASSGEARIGGNTLGSGRDSGQPDSDPPAPFFPGPAPSLPAGAPPPAPASAAGAQHTPFTMAREDQFSSRIARPSLPVQASEDLGGLRSLPGAKRTAGVRPRSGLLRHRGENLAPRPELCRLHRGHRRWFVFTCARPIPNAQRPRVAEELGRQRDSTPTIAGRTMGPAGRKVCTWRARQALGRSEQRILVSGPVSSSHCIL